MTDRDLWVGIDVGTQSVRVLVVADDGAVHGAGTARLTSERDGDRHEQDPEHWWIALGEASRQAVATVDPANVRGIALAATSGTVLLVDHAGRPQTPGLMYDDSRARAEAERATNAGSDLWTRLGYQQMQPSWALPKLMWLMAHTPQAGRLAHQSDFLTARLVGQPVATDLSSALKTGADLIAEDWPQGVMGALDVPPSVLPPVVRSGARIGTVASSATDHTGLIAGTPVIAGMTDGCAAQLSAGVVAPGDWNSVLGTTLVLKGVSEEIVADPSGVVYSHRSPSGSWLPGGASSSGAGALNRELPGGDLNSLAEQAPRYTPSSVLTYPLAAARGERFPFVAPSARPFRVGSPRDDAEVYVSIAQGVAFVERLCFAHLERLGAAVDGRVVFSGGAVASRYWSQLRADILGRPVTLTAQPEGALGMAVLAAASERGLNTAAKAMVKEIEVLEPRADVHARFTEPYSRFVAELKNRGWLDPAFAYHARQGADGTEADA